MRILLDTSVLSELRKKDCDKKLKEFVTKTPDENIFISVLSVGEIEKGISLLGTSRKKKNLRSWIQNLLQFYSDRILEIDTEIAQIWGEITASAQRRGIIIPAIDGLIASTAIRHGLHLVTKNIRDFENTDVMMVDL